MSSTQNTASPRAPRAKPSKGSTQTPPSNLNKTPRRPKGNRAHSANHANSVANAHNGGSDAQAPPVMNALDALASDSALPSSEEGAASRTSRNPKKKNQPHPTPKRILSSNAVAASSLTDNEPGSAPAVVGTPAKVQAAYAGPTFHASPAPSALPVPKFLSKSVPAKTRAAPPTPPPEDESDSGTSPTPSPSRAPIPIPPRQLDSPLDFFFKAQRAETGRTDNTSPASASFSSPNQPSTAGRPPHVKQDSFHSLNAPFPFELDSGVVKPRASPPVASPDHRSNTAPGFPQGSSSNNNNDDTGAINDLINRLSMSHAQNKSTSSTPPRPVEHVPSDPAMRNHASSPFYDGRSPFVRSASGPSTPNPVPPENPDFFYGNRNLSPMFTAVKSDASKRNSGLRTEVTANSPLMTQGGFSQPPPANVDTRALLGNLFNAPTSPRRGSAPQIPQVQPMAPNHAHWPPTNEHQAHMRSPQMRSPRGRPTRPGSYHARNNSGHLQGTNGTSPALQKTTTAMAFIPSSVRAKPAAPAPKKVESDPVSLEQDLKRMLNVSNGNTNGVH